MQRSETLSSSTTIVNLTHHDIRSPRPETGISQRVGPPRIVSNVDMMEQEEEEDTEKKMMVAVLSPSPWSEVESPRLTSPLHPPGDRSNDFLRDESTDVFADAPLTKFPWRLHEMLEDAERCGFSKIVSWLPGNKAFRVHQQSRFEQSIMPKYFRQTKFKSFRRQINMWSFQRIKLGEGRGGYFHGSFVRGKPDLCLGMKRTKLKGISRVVGTQNTKLPLKLENQRSPRNIEHLEVHNKQLQDCHDPFMCFPLCPQDKRFSWLRDHEAFLWSDAYKAAELSLKLPSPVYSSDEIREEIISIFGGTRVALMLL